MGVNTAGEYQQGKVWQLTKQEMLMLNIGSIAAGARVLAVNRRTARATLQLVNPMCTNIGEKIALRRRVDKHWRLIGWAEIQGGQTI